MNRSLPTLNFRRTHIAALAVAAAVTAAMLIGSGPTYAAAPALTHSAPAASLSITVHPTQLGKRLHAGFAGLSFGAATIAQDNYASTDLAGFLQTLGHTGVMRVGANSGDETFWTSANEPPPSWAIGTITPAKLQHLATIVKAAGWKVILGVNLKHLDAARAADEAKYAQQIFGTSLQAIEIGNEPNFYYTSVSAYYNDFETYVAAIKKTAPGVAFEGPDAETNHSSWLGGFASLEAGHPDVAEITDHTYPTSACSGSTATIPELLSTNSDQYETSNAQATVSAAGQLGVPGTMTETNSTVCGGTPGVSNVFAAALWSLDYNLLIAQHGIANAEYMGGLNSANACDPYAPLCPTTGNLTAQPVYYGMLATGLVGSGRFATVNNPDAANVRAYAVMYSRRLTVVLDDVQDPSSNGATTVTLKLGAIFPTGKLMTLKTSSSAGLSATTGITLGGGQVGAHGVFPAPQTTPVTVSNQTATVTVPAGSAAIIQFG